MKSNLLILLVICTGILGINLVLLSAAKPIPETSACGTTCDSTPKPPQGGSLKNFEANRIAECMNMGKTYNQCK